MSSAGDREPERVRSAMRVMQNAYAPYSRFRVGAVLVGADGAEYAGCNVENSSFPAGLCAERAALAVAVAAGARSFAALIIATEADAPTPPCGLCRQALVEFGGQLDIVSATSRGARRHWNLQDLLPSPFTPDSLAHA